MQSLGPYFEQEHRHGHMSLALVIWNTLRSELDERNEAIATFVGTVVHSNRRKMYPTLIGISI